MFLYMELSVFLSTIYWGGSLSCIVQASDAFVVDELIMCVRGYFWDLCSVPLLCVCFCSSSILFGALQPCGVVWGQGLWFLQRYYSFSSQFWLFRVVCASIQMLKLFVIVLRKKGCWYFDRDCFKSIACLGHFSNISSFNSRTWYISPSVCIIFSFLYHCLIFFWIYVLHLHK